MTVDKAVKLLKNELACVQTDACDHSCGDCLLAGNQDEIAEALNMAIDALADKQSKSEFRRMVLQGGLQSAT